MQQADAFFDDPASPMYGEVRIALIKHQGKEDYFVRRA